LEPQNSHNPDSNPIHDFLPDFYYVVKVKTTLVVKYSYLNRLYENKFLEVKQSYLDFNEAKNENP